jgi:cytochrome c553
MLSRVLLAALLWSGCNAQASAGDEPPAPVRIAKPEMVRFHMNRHFDDLQAIQRLLVSGKLAEAKSLAFMLTKPATDPGLAPWAAESASVTEAARALVAAPGVDEALRREARVAVACAYCHVHTQQAPVFAAPPTTPTDEANTASAMARHQWAVDRLWEGVVGGSDRPWRAGLEVLGATPLPYSPAAPALATRLQQLARSAMTAHREQTETLDERGRLYGEMLVTCAACHQQLKH